MNLHASPARPAHHNMTFCLTWICFITNIVTCEGETLAVAENGSMEVVIWYGIQHFSNHSMHNIPYFFNPYTDGTQDYKSKDIVLMAPNVLYHNENYEDFLKPITGRLPE
ncbi:hypothetical protein ACJX0J_017179 [Zea mays]